MEHEKQCFSPITDERSCFSVYCNSLSVGFSLYDFEIILREKFNNNEKQLGIIKMSPQHAKVFAQILNDNIAVYENIFGPIPEPKEEKLREAQEKGEINIG
ncbi:MAG TPA: DUF3467 domain-containing protein [Clostridia bacterium]|nr:DUF3467 domain-containing protein [Clostridia bacterium]